ncbi:hypothetical protein EW146_g7136 [Bondarzewia mesenterica]|uniref:RRM Nup35-type domain-containing protein n=1 Tax=Bondarzewia mesenterica TaxID=1095465 RepID=A0A4S4LNF4_9AGAM|nr:hypothetical protein EW146_g7136 [Bondarzewia mesenterica]
MALALGTLKTQQVLCQICRATPFTSQGLITSLAILCLRLRAMHLHLEANVFDELPVVQIKAKLNNTLSRGPTAEFGKDPMFESSRQRPTLDEDAPPTASVNDIVNATYPDNTAAFSRRNHNFDVSVSTPFLQRPAKATSQPTSDVVYIIVFGYPPDKYSVAVDYFKQLGESTEPDPNTDIINCFRIGYKNPGDAMRAVRKNGEIIAGSWMIGAKWADPTQADNIFGQTLRQGTAFAAQSPDSGAQPPSSPSDAMVVDDSQPFHFHYESYGTRQSQATPTIGTPIRLAPSSSAFKKPGTGPKTGLVPPPPQFVPPPTATGSAAATPTKGVLGQVSDLIFGCNHASQSSNGNSRRQGHFIQVAKASDGVVAPAAVALVDYSLMVSLVFGGCCTNVWAYERLLRLESRVGSALTFSQMLFITLQQLPSFLTWKPSNSLLPRLKPRQVPLSQWLLQVAVLATGSLLNNWVYAFHVPLTVQIVFRSAGLAVSMLFGRFLMNKRYSFRQVIAVSLVSIGVVVATLSGPSASSSQSTDNLARYALGVTMLAVSLVLTGILGMLQERTYQSMVHAGGRACFTRYRAIVSSVLGIHADSSKHALSLPVFLFLIPQVKYGLEGLSQSSNSVLPVPYIILAANLLSQLVCVSGVNQLSSVCRRFPPSAYLASC